MKSRKMWAEPGVLQEGGSVLCFAKDRETAEERNIFMPRVPVLVIDASNMPDFEPGDRVRMAGYENLKVLHPPIRLEKAWWVPCYSPPEGIRCFAANHLTKLPREKTVLPTYRITGDPEAVEYALRCIDGYATGSKWEARVERVEDPDAKGGER